MRFVSTAFVMVTMALMLLALTLLTGHWCWPAAAFFAGGDGGSRSPEHSRRNLCTSFAAASDCRTGAIM